MDTGQPPWRRYSRLWDARLSLLPHTHTHRQCLCTHVRAEGFFFERINMTNSLQSTEVLDREQLLAVG